MAHRASGIAVSMCATCQAEGLGAPSHPELSKLQFKMQARLLKSVARCFSWASVDVSDEALFILGKAVSSACLPSPRSLKGLIGPS